MNTKQDIGREWYECVCGEIFSDETADHREEVETSEFWGCVQTTTSRYTICPACHGEAFSTYDACSICTEEGEPHPRECVEGMDMCLEHFREIDPDEYQTFAELYPEEVTA